MTIPGSCSNGFKSRPSSAAGISRSNGFDVNSMNSRKPTLTRPITAMTLARSAGGRWREKTLTANVQPVSISVHNSSEPSCEPHVAAKR